MDDELLSRLTLSLSLSDIRCTQWPLCAVVFTLCYGMGLYLQVSIFSFQVHLSLKLLCLSDCLEVSNKCFGG